MTRVTLLFMALVLATPACANRKAGIPVSSLPPTVPVEKLRRTEYVVDKVTTGRDCATVLVLFPLPIWFNSSGELGTRAFIFTTAEARARQGAVYRALENAPEADFLTAPRVKTDGATFGPWGGRTCYELKARAARLKEDHELPPENLEVDVSVRRSQGAQ